jgi:hypothetical protein
MAIMTLGLKRGQISELQCEPLMGHSVSQSYLPFYPSEAFSSHELLLTSSNKMWVIVRKYSLISSNTGEM